MSDKNIVVGVYDNVIDAEIAKGHLTASGILSSIMKDDGGGMIPSLQNAEGVQLVVSETQSEDAVKILHTTST